MSSPPAAHEEWEGRAKKLRGAPTPLKPLLGSGAPPGAAARSEEVVLAAQKYYVKVSSQLFRNVVK
jgi:hypothetical protein